MIHPEESNKYQIVTFDPGTFRPITTGKFSEIYSPYTRAMGRFINVSAMVRHYSDAKGEGGNRGVAYFHFLNRKETGYITTGNVTP